MKRIFLLVNVLVCLFASHLSAARYNAFQVEQVDLDHYPNKIETLAQGSEVTIGDLHGNAQKLLYFLIKNGVLKLSVNDYRQMSQLIKTKTKKLTAIKLSRFQALLNSAKVSDKTLIRFLGDDVCDRGMNDIFTLKIFTALDKARVPFEIIYSNHGNFFIKAYERKEQSFSYNPYGKGRHVSTVQSMLNMGRLIDDGIVDKVDVLAMLEQHYLKHIRFPAYTINRRKQEITLYSHAPIDLVILKGLAEDLNVEFNDNSLTELEHSLDNINAVVSQWILRHQFTLNYDRLNKNHKQNKTLSPITQILWNRDYTILDRRHSPKGKPYKVNYVHGHDSQSNVFDLDNLFGKGQHNQVGPYAVHITHR